MIRVTYSTIYIQDYRDLLSKNQDLVEEVDKRIKWFRDKPSDTRLGNHQLTGKLAGRWAFSITGEIRILYKLIGKNRVIFLAIGGHNKVYARKVN